MATRRGSSRSGDASLASNGLEYSRRSMRARRAAADALVGELLDARYRILRLLGEGGMGAVFAAEDIDSGRVIALKVLHPTAFTDENLRRFRREARATFRLNHPNICPVHAWGALRDGSPYIVMELLKGETLRTRLRETGALRVADAVAVLLQLAAALANAHTRGVLHRDVKPGNVFVTTDRGRAPKVKLIDFGLVKLLPTWNGATHPDEPSVITKTGVTPGTPQYLSPEQIDGTRDIDERADVWALGVVLFETLTAQRPFKGETYQELAAAIATEQPNIRAVRLDIHERLEAVILGALFKDRRLRYANAHVFREALLEAWAHVRAEDVARARGLLRSARVHIPPAPEPNTEVRVPIFLDSGSTLPTLRGKG